MMVKIEIQHYVNNNHLGRISNEVPLEQLRIIVYHNESVAILKNKCFNSLLE